MYLLSINYFNILTKTATAMGDSKCSQKKNPCMYANQYSIYGAIFLYIIYYDIIVIDISDLNYNGYNIIHCNI